MSGSPHAKRLNLEDVVMVAFGGGFSVPPRSYSSLLMKLGAQISSWLSLLKEASSAPATVPVASNGSEAYGDQANVDVLWISLSFMAARGTEGDWRDQKVEDVSAPEDQTPTFRGRMQSLVITTAQIGV